MAAASWRRLLAHCVRCAARLAPAKAGISNAIRMPMIMTTVRSSIRVKPPRNLFERLSIDAPLGGINLEKLAAALINVNRSPNRTVSNSAGACRGDTCVALVDPPCAKQGEASLAPTQQTTNRRLMEDTL